MANDPSKEPAWLDFPCFGTMLGPSWVFVGSVLVHFFGGLKMQSYTDLVSETKLWTMSEVLGASKKIALRRDANFNMFVDGSFGIDSFFQKRVEGV